MLLKGAIIGFSIAAPVGAIGVLVIRRTLTEGRAAGLISGLGAATADAIYGSIAGFGLTFIANLLVEQSFWIRLIGGCFLLYIGVKTFVTRPAALLLEQTEINPGRKGLLGAYVSVFFLTLTNPLTIITYMSVLAGLGIGGTDSNYILAMTLVLGVFLGSGLWWAILSGGISLLRRWFLQQAVLRWVNRVSGLIIACFGLVTLATVLRTVL